MPYIRKEIVEEGQYAIGRLAFGCLFCREQLCEIQVAFHISFEVEQYVVHLDAVDSKMPRDGFEQFDVKRKFAEICHRVAGGVLQDGVLYDDSVKKRIIYLTELQTAVDVS